MPVIPGNQDTGTFLGGNYHSPNMLGTQIPGTSNLPQLYQPQNYQPQSMNTPQANPFNSAVLNSLMNGVPNSGSNHAISNGGFSPSFGQQTSQNAASLSAPQIQPQLSMPQQPQQPQQYGTQPKNTMMNGMFGNAGQQ